MLGKRSPQENLFTVDHQYLSFVGEDSFFGYLATHRHELFCDDDFAFLYCADNGRPSVAPSLLACALLLQWYDNVSDQEATDRAKYDLRWKVALGLQMDEEPFVKSTLQLFRAQLIVHEQARKLFEASLAHARQQRFFKSPRLKVALDTTPIFGKGAVEDTYNLLAESLRQVLRVLAELDGKEYDVFACEHDFRRYTEPSFKGTVAIDWDNEAEREAVLTSLVADCDRILVEAGRILSRYAAESPEAARIQQATELLRKLLVQDVKRTEAQTAELIEGVAADRIVSVHDPEMRHGRKSASQRFNGYKAAVAVDTDNQLITAVDVLSGNAHDARNAQALIEQTEQNTQATVEMIIGDTAFGSIEQRLEAQQHERTLIAPIPKPPHTGQFTKDDFQIDLVAERVTCPAGMTTTELYSQKRRTRRGREFTNKVFRFSGQQCQACALRAQCLKPGASRQAGRTVTVHQHEALLQEAKRFQRTGHFRELYRLRVTVEHRIARLVQLGLRKARYFGTAKLLFQIAMTAAVANLTLIATGSTTASSFLSLVPFLAVLILCVLLLQASTAIANTNRAHQSVHRLYRYSKPKMPTFRLGF